MKARLILSMLFLLGCAAADGTDVAPPPPPKSWSDQQKCENMCQGYCVQRQMCDGTSVDRCRMTIDQADGGTCARRAHLFENLSEQEVQACIDAIAAMACPDFLYMYSTGRGIPGACEGILY